MINFVIITDTPARLRDFLIARNIIKQETDPRDQSPILTGVLPGMEWERVPNPIQISPGVYDDRAVYLVKFAWESEAQKADAFRDWILANSSVQNAPPNYLIGGVHAGSARKITGEQVWLVHIDPERFGVWQ
jgi:hypothetical protein